jgi:uncharacterized protein YdhG (YjbR/CyaY superfamily)
METQGKFRTIDEYIDACPAEVQERLRALRQVVKEAAPDAQEAFTYGMPTFKLNGNLVHFAAFKDHIGFYPTPSGIDAFPEALAQYKTGKGTLRFPLDEPLPLPLIRTIVEHRVRENRAKAKGKR